MPRPLLTALVAFVAIPLMARADEPKPSPAVKRILEDAARKVRTNRQAFDKANEKPLAEARQELQDLSTKLIKDEKTDEAGAVLKQVKTLDADVMRMANAPMPVRGVGGQAGPQKPLLERMAGKWAHGVGGVSVEQDGSFTNQNGDKGRLKLVAPDMAEIIWGSGYKWHSRLVNDDLMAVVEWDANGNRTVGAVLDRVK